MATKTISAARIVMWLGWIDKAIEATQAGNGLALIWIEALRTGIIEASLADVEIETIEPAPAASPAESERP